MSGAMLSDEILAENAAVFEAMLRHRFVADIEHDRLPEDVFLAYLRYEGAFVETAISIFALAVAKSPGIDESRWLIGVLDALANDQIAYFERTFAHLGISGDIGGDADPRVTAFRDGMIAIARDGSFLDIVVAMFAAEWMYWTWCSAASRTGISDPVLKEWVQLHATPAFADQARWLKAEIDAAGGKLSRAEKARLSSIFARVTEMEIAFHDAAYGERRMTAFSASAFAKERT